MPRFHPLLWRYRAGYIDRMAVYAIGDVQGCLDPLLRLLDKLSFDASCDTLWFTGDLVNRGPESLAVLRLVRSMGKRAVVVLGNHDLHLLALANGIKPGKRSGSDTIEPILVANDRDVLLDWLRCRPLLHFDAELDYTLVHAGLPPQWNIETARMLAGEVEAALCSSGYRSFMLKMYGDRPRRWSEKLTGIKRLRFILNCLTRMRYCTRQGRLDFKRKGPPPEKHGKLLPWFRVPARASAGQRIVFGHWSALGRLREQDIVALDSGCVWGGQLSALRLDAPSDFVSVPCAT